MDGTVPEASTIRIGWIAAITAIRNLLIGGILGLVLAEATRPLWGLVLAIAYVALDIFLTMLIVRRSRKSRFQR